MQPALRLGEAAPAAGPLVFSRHHSSRAWPAADAGVALVVQRIVGDIVLTDERPNLCLRPVGERAHFDKAELFVPTDDRGLRPVWTLIAADRTGPGVETDDRLLQNLHLAVEAALIGIVAIDRPPILPLIFF